MESSERKTLHRSENLWVGTGSNPRTVEFEIRFSTCQARGSADRGCPRCGKLGVPAEWQLEGPDGPNNTVWMACADVSACGGERGQSFRWMADVRFPDGWDERSG